MKTGIARETWGAKLVSVAASAALVAATMCVVAPQDARADMRALSIYKPDAIEVTYADKTTEKMTFDDFADAVNSGTSFKGATVALTADIDTDDLAEPIGSPKHPFEGTFDGGEHRISDLDLRGEEYVGLFGYVGPSGSIKNLHLTDAKVSASSSKRIVRYVGSIAGYIHGGGADGGVALENCTSDAKVSASSTMKIDESKHERYKPTGNAADATAEGYSDDGVAIEYVGGLAGFVAGSVKGCAFGAEKNTKASVTVTDKQDPDPDRAAIARSVGGIAGQAGGFTSIVSKSDADKASHEPSYPTETGFAVEDDESLVRTVSACTNWGRIETNVTGVSKLDRFGQETSATASGIGGIVGRSMAHIEDCTNKANIDAPTGSQVGGVVGSVRSVAFSGPNSSYADAGIYKDPTAEGSARFEGPLLTVENCTNNGDLDLLNAGGGIAGSCGTYTKVHLCKNLGSSLEARRWNKPTGAGIVGDTYGDIDHCYNRADVTSTTGAGYYMAGIVGMASRFSASDNAEIDTAPPEISACYSTGNVEVTGDFRQGGIVGENLGYVHDCLFLEDHVYSDRVAGLDLGTIADSVEAISTTKLKSKDMVAALNASTSVADYQSGACFVQPGGDGKKNNRYPVFAAEREAEATGNFAENQAKLAISKTGAASYSASSNPVPSFGKGSVKFGTTSLVQGADFYVVPDEGALKDNGDGKKICKDVKDIAGEEFNAEFGGIGDYEGTTSGLNATYTIGKGDFKDCTATIVSKTFNFLVQEPAKGTDAKVLDAAGNEVPTESYTMEQAEEPDGKKKECVNHQKVYDSKGIYGGGEKRWYTGYPFKFTASGDSNYTGEVYGWFQIKKADLVDEKKSAIEGISFNGASWNWKLGTSTAAGSEEGYAYRMVNGKEEKGIDIAYTGAKIAPTVAAVKYLAGEVSDANKDFRTLELGKDYRLVYGDPGDSGNPLGDDAAAANTNVTTGKVGQRACVTVRFIPGDDCNFTNYQNIFFTISQADIAKDCTVSLPSSINTLADKPSVTVKGYTGATIPASNYSVSVKLADAKPAKVTITGKNNLKGSVTKTIGVNHTSVADATVTLAKTSYPYTGKAVAPGVVVKIGNTILKKGSDYTVSYASGRTKVGSYSVTISGAGAFSGKKTVSFKIVKAANPLKASAAKVKTVSASKLKKKKQVVSKLVVAKKAQGKLSYKKAGGSPKLAVDAKTAKVTVKKGTKKGTYSVKVKVRAAGNANYASAVKTVTVKVKVK